MKNSRCQTQVFKSYLQVFKWQLPCTQCICHLALKVSTFHVTLPPLTLIRCYIACSKCPNVNESNYLGLVVFGKAVKKTVQKLPPFCLYPPLLQKKTKILKALSDPEPKPLFIQMINVTNKITSIIAISEESQSYSYNIPYIFIM